MAALPKTAVFVGSGIFKSSPDPSDQLALARAIVEATTHYQDPEIGLKVSHGLRRFMKGEEDPQVHLEERGW